MGGKCTSNRGQVQIRYFADQARNFNESKCFAGVRKGSPRLWCPGNSREGRSGAVFCLTILSERNGQICNTVLAKAVKNLPVRGCRVHSKIWLRPPPPLTTASSGILRLRTGWQSIPGILGSHRKPAIIELIVNHECQFYDQCDGGSKRPGRGGVSALLLLLC